MHVGRYAHWLWLVPKGHVKDYVQIAKYLLGYMGYVDDGQPFCRPARLNNVLRSLYWYKTDCYGSFTMIAESLGLSGFAEKIIIWSLGSSLLSHGSKTKKMKMDYVTNQARSRCTDTCIGSLLICQERKHKKDGHDYDIWCDTNVVTKIVLLPLIMYTTIMYCASKGLHRSGGQTDRCTRS